MNIRRSILRRASLAFALMLCCQGAVHASITFNLTAAFLNDANGNPMPTTGLVILVASTNDSQFGGPTPTSFTSGDDIELARWDLSAIGIDGVLLDTTGALNLFGGWNTGDPLMLYWFPTLSKTSMQPGAGVRYGQYRDPSGIDGSAPWVTPSDGANIELKFLTASAGGSNPDSRGNATNIISGGTTSMAVASFANPSLPGSSITFTATVSVVSGAGTPTGTVTFKDGAATLGTGSLNGSGVATFSTSSLSHGTHSISAGYPGDGSFTGSTNSLTAAQVVNTPPTPSLATYSRSTNFTLKIPIADLITNYTTDADGDARSLLSVGLGTNGATIMVSGSYVFYVPSTSTPNRNTTDHFDYGIGDGFTGGTATNRIRVVVVDPNGGGQSANMTGINIVTNGVQVTFSGIPSYIYHVQRTTLLQGSGTVWTDLGTATADNIGRGEFTDTNPPQGGAYYRTVWP